MSALPGEQRPWGAITWLSEVFAISRVSVYALGKQLAGRGSETRQRAGELLQKIDTSPLGLLIAIRDETFFQGQPILLVVDPVSLTILLAEVCSDRQAETWGIALP